MARLHGTYTTRVLINDTFTVEYQMWEDSGWCGYESIDFPSAGSEISTPAGYEKTTEGAYEYAAKIFGTKTRARSSGAPCGGGGREKKEYDNR